MEFLPALPTNGDSAKKSEGHTLKGMPSVCIHNLFENRLLKFIPQFSDYRRFYLRSHNTSISEYNP